jgi:hypothetical protein
MVVFRVQRTFSPQTEIMLLWWTGHHGAFGHILHHAEVGYCAIVGKNQQVRFGKHIFIVMLKGSSTAEHIIQDIRGFFDKTYNALWLSAADGIVTGR